MLERSDKIHILERDRDILVIRIDPQAEWATFKHYVIERECSVIIIGNEHPGGCVIVVGYNRRIGDGDIPGATRGISLNAVRVIGPTFPLSQCTNC